MEAVLGVLLIVGVVIWVCGRSSSGPDRQIAAPRRGPPAPPMSPSSTSNSDDAAFFDGYIWGRLQERHDEHQHGHGAGHDHDVFDGDDCLDDD